MLQSGVTSQRANEQETQVQKALTSIYQYASSLILGASGIMYNECAQLYIFMVSYNINVQLLDVSFQVELSKLVQ